MAPPRSLSIARYALRMPSKNSCCTVASSTTYHRERQIGQERRETHVLSENPAPRSTRLSACDRPTVHPIACRRCRCLMFARILGRTQMRGRAVHKKVRPTEKHALVRLTKIMYQVQRRRCAALFKTIPVCAGPLRTSRRSLNTVV